MSGDSGISAFPEEDNIFCWKGTITGSKDTIFEGTKYKLSLSFPVDFPFKPPKVKFETGCFHPNVDVYGNICLDILQVTVPSESCSNCLDMPYKVEGLLGTVSVSYCSWFGLISL